MRIKIAWQHAISELPKIPVIYDNDQKQFASVAGPYDEGSDQAFVCAVTGGM